MMPPRKPQGPPPPPPKKSNLLQPIKVNTKTANVNQTKNNSFSTNLKSKKPKNWLIIAIIVLLALAAVAGAFFLLQERQDIRKGAVSSGKLICMPVDNNGNITNDKYRYDRMLVKNETDQDIQVKIQTNLCPYQGQNPQPGYRCDDYVSANPYIVRAGTQVILPNNDTASWLPKTWVACQKIGQLDVQKDKDHYQHIGVDPNSIPDCFNTVDNRVWEGGIAFTIKANPEPCCPDITLSVEPNNPNPADPIIIKASSPEALACTEISHYTGLATPPGNWRVSGQYNWSWEGVAGDDPGQYSVTFRGNTEDSGQGECPDRAIGDWCQATTNFNVGSSPPSPTPTETEPTPTQPQYTCNCHTIKIYDQDKNLLAQDQLEKLEAGNLIYIGVVANNGYPNYPVSKAKVRVNRNYWLEQDETTEKINHDYPLHLAEFIKPYTIPEGALTFKIEAEVYLDGPSGIGGWF
ncbi:MAG: hypothetical protein PHR64_00495 [Candidatus Shapirobacteria bacterium]|nr:hypothetical protein [Candidatus Shapirobacteria bacterium]MDD5073623.1 hypothetical protein [Candidatus Shapirobacteria bacterium]MDD5481416.1 hypothetical protein [Candidatus Shapirobacteria bacterium]